MNFCYGCIADAHYSLLIDESGFQGFPVIADASSAQFPRPETEVCREIGPDSPLTPASVLFHKIAEPWNPETRTLDFEMLFPVVEPSGSDWGDRLVEKLKGRYVTAMLLAQAIRPDERLENEVRGWGGQSFATITVFVVAPLLMIVLIATALAPLLKLRWTLVKRVRRIVA